MAVYFIKRIFGMIFVLVIVSAITFILMHSAPGGPWDRDPTARQVDATTQRILNEYYGLDKPLWQQYVAYMIGDKNTEGEFVCGLVCGNMGPSYRVRGRTVQDILFKPPSGKPFWYSRAGYSARLGFFALGFAIFVGIPLGIISALRQNTIADYISLFIATVGVSVPNFVMAIFMIIIFASWLHMISVVPKEWTSFSAWILPALVLGFGTMAFTARLMRTAMLEVVRQDYIRTARAKGLAERDVINRHMIRNALIPVVTILGPALAGLVTGSFIIETMFGFPGMGRAYVMAIGQRDYSMILGTTLVFVFLVSVANLTVDFVYTLIDPRIKLKG